MKRGVLQKFMLICSFIRFLILSNTSGTGYSKHIITQMIANENYIDIYYKTMNDPSRYLFLLIIVILLYSFIDKETQNICNICEYMFSCLSIFLFVRQSLRN